MGRISYLTRRGGGVYYVQLRHRPDVGLIALCRFSLHTCDHRVARRRLVQRLAWLIPIRDAMTTEDRIDALLRSLATYKSKGRPVDEEDRQDRSAFAESNQLFVERVAAASAPPAKALALQLAWTQFLTIANIASRSDLPSPASRRAASQRDEGERRGGEAEVASSPAPTSTLNGATNEAEPSRQPSGSHVEGAARMGRQCLSEVLQKYLDYCRKKDGNGRAEDNVAPIVRFAISLLDNPSLADLHGDNLLKLRTEMSDIPTNLGFKMEERDLHSKWRIARACGFSRENGNGKVVKLKRTSKSTLENRYGAGLRAIWTWASGLDGTLGKDPPDFSAITKANPGKQKRDAFSTEEIARLFSMPLFQGCQRPPRVWQAGEFFCQNFFYWSVLITLLGGLRPGETSQLRCRDIVELYGKPHFRFARFSEGDDGDDDHEDRPGANQGKSPAAYRWVPIHPLLIRLGIIDRRDGIMDAVATSVARTGRSQGESMEAAGNQWLFPDWKVYVKRSGAVLWSHTVTKAWSHLKETHGFDRKGISFYSARHAFKGFIDDLNGLSDRSRRMIMGHSAASDVHGQYGPKKITERQTEITLELDNATIAMMTQVLVAAKERAERKELRVLETWRDDVRMSDRAFQAVMASRRQQY